MLEMSHSPLLIIASFAVAILGSFTTLRLTSNLRILDVAARKTRVMQAAFVLGVSIWSMHFTAMLAMKLADNISYDTVRTLISALLAILAIEVVFLFLHFGKRTKSKVFIAGIITGGGILGMHYLGMSAISDNVRIVYNPMGVVITIIVGILSSILAMKIAYGGERSFSNTVLGAIILGLAMSAIHHTAMYFTMFSQNAAVNDTAISLLNGDQLALLVAISSFTLSSLFLLLVVPTEKQAVKDEVIEDEQEIAETPEPSQVGVMQLQETQIPYEQENLQRFLPKDKIYFIRASGHYTLISDGTKELFCPWSISRVRECLDPNVFIGTHRSYMVNKNHFKGIKRRGDKSYCIINNEAEDEIPISRSRMNEFKQALQLN